MIRLTRTDPAKNMHRYYRLSIQPDLFGGFNLMREWGRIGKGGQCRQEYFESECQACHVMFELMRVKQKKGYKKSAWLINAGNI